jgi:hypothetical protein
MIGTKQPFAKRFNSAAEPLVTSKVRKQELVEVSTTKFPASERRLSHLLKADPQEGRVSTGT